jgi:hypothetical protein
LSKEGAAQKDWFIYYKIEPSSPCLSSVTGIEKNGIRILIRRAEKNNETCIGLTQRRLIEHGYEVRQDGVPIRRVDIQRHAG